MYPKLAVDTQFPCDLLIKIMKEMEAFFFFPFESLFVNLIELSTRRWGETFKV
jgi:hypothetical protein